MPFTQCEIDQAMMMSCKVVYGLCDGSCRDMCKIIGVSAPLLGSDLRPVRRQEVVKFSRAVQLWKRLLPRMPWQ